MSRPLPRPLGSTAGPVTFCSGKGGQQDVSRDSFLELLAARKAASGSASTGLSRSREDRGRVMPKVRDAARLLDQDGWSLVRTTNSG